jgi:ABC-type lipoprotein release transport system permease subunit
MSIALYAWRANWRRSWRTVLTVALIGGLLGAVALAALAGARRTDSAYGRYLRAVKASDVMVDIPGALKSVVYQIENLPAVSTAAWLGLNANPVIDGKVDDNFETNGIAASLDGEYFRQDKLTVLAGTMPNLHSADEIAITQPMAQAFHVHPGDHMTWQFYRNPLDSSGIPTGAPPKAAQRTTFLVTAIAAMPPALGDNFDDIDGAILTPAAAPGYLNNAEWSFAWVAMRLHGGFTGVPALEEELAKIGKNPKLELLAGGGQDFGPVSFNIRVLAIAQREAQQAIEPQAVALAILGGLIALALLVLVGQALAQLLGRSAGDGATLRAIGATRAEAALALAVPGVLAIAGSIALAVAGAYALSPLAPVGPVRGYDPQTGAQADWLVLGGGAAALLLLLGSLLAWLSWRAAGQAADAAATRPLALITASRRSGLPVAALTGMRYALERGYGRQRAPVRATLAGSVIAVTGLAVSLVFGSSLTGLASHPAQYGWNWSALIQAQGGWGAWPPDAIAELMEHQQGVTGWSQFGFSQLIINDLEVPVMGVQQELGSVQPPTISGHPLAGTHQIELGAVTMRALGVHAGEKVSVRVAPGSKQQETFTVVGTVTLPSFGTVLTDHVSLGRGALMDETALLRVEGLPPYTQRTFNEVASGSGAGAIGSPSFPSAIAIDTTSAAAARLVTQAVLVKDIDQSPGGMYALGPQQGAQVIDLQQMGPLPLTISLGVAIAAVLALALTIAASVRQRRRELALLKSLGMRRSQLRAVVACQASTILVVAVVVGVPLGIAAGRWAWTAFASEIGVVPAPVVPAAALALGVLAILVAGNLLATWPAAVAARTSVARVLRSE